MVRDAGGKREQMSEEQKHPWMGRGRGSGK